MNAEVERERLRGMENLPPCDRGHFTVSFPTLLGRSVQCKKNWLEAVHFARNRQAQREGQEADAMDQTHSRQDIRNWIETTRRRQMP